MAHLEQVASEGGPVSSPPAPFLNKHSLSIRSGSALLPQTPNPSSSLGAPDANRPGIALLYSNTMCLSIDHQLSASHHHLHPAPGPQATRSDPPHPALPARTHTLRLFSALGPPALHPPQMKGPSSASALGRQRAAAAASSATAAAPAAPSRGTAAV